jgi:hypothetical protein
VNRLLMTATLTVLPLACASAAVAANGVRVTSKRTSAHDTSTDEIQLDKDHLRFDSLGADGHPTRTTIFDAEKQVMWIVQPDKKTYNELTREDFERLYGQFSAMAAQMQERMKNLPPEQRAKLEKAMQGRGMAVPASKPEFHKTGSDHVGKWACDVYEQMENGAKSEEVCAASMAQLGLTPADLNVVTQLQNLFKHMLPPALGNRAFALGDAEMQGFPGIAIRRVSYSGGHEQTREEMVDLTHGAIPDAAFVLPEGFTKKPMMGQ